MQKSATGPRVGVAVLNIAFWWRIQVVLARMHSLSTVCCAMMSAKNTTVYICFNAGSVVCRRIGKNRLLYLQTSAQRKITTPQRPGSSVKISMFYHAPTDIKRYIFADVASRRLYTTVDSGRTINTVSSLPFVPDALSVHPVKPWVVLGHDKTSANRALYKSDDFGRSWTRIQVNVDKAEWGYSTSSE